MSPCIPAPNLLDGGSSKTKLFDEFLGLSGATFDVPCLIFGELGRIGFLSISVASLSVPICDVFYLSAKKQVLNVHAQRGVAGVANAHSFGDRLFGLQKPSSSMSTDVYAVCPELSISVPAYTPCIEPAVVFFGDENFFPESFGYGKVFDSHEDLLGVVVVRGTGEPEYSPCPELYTAGWL